MPIVSLLDLEQSLKLNQLLIDSNLNGSSNSNITNLLLKNSNTSVASSTMTAQPTTNSALLANALIQQIQQQNLNNKFFNNNILLNCIKSNLAANLNSASNTSLNSQNQDNPKQINYSRYKTELCRQFSENGECKYGDKCQFAHGFNDLKDVNRHPKYKTDYCKTFHSKGFCPYGPRCHFIHEFYEKSDLELNDKVKPTTNTKSALNNNKSNNQETNQEIDKQLEAIQVQLASSLFSTIVEESNNNDVTTTSSISGLLSDTTTTTDNKSDKTMDLLDEFNQSVSSFGCPTNSFSPVISSSSSSSTSVSSSTSPTLSANNRMFVKKKLQQLATNGTIYDNEDVFQSNDQKLSKQLLDLALNKSNNDENDLFQFLNQVKLSSPPSPAPIRTRSSTSSTSSSASMSSTSTSSDYYDRIQSPIKQSQQRFLNINDLKLYALTHQQDQQIDMISIKLNKDVAKTKPRYGPIGKPLNENAYEMNQQQILANINLLMNQKNMTISNDLLLKSSLNRQMNW